MLTCEMTFDGPECDLSAWGGIGFIHPVTDQYRCVLLSCRTCAIRLMDETDEQFRVLDVDLAQRLQAKLHPSLG